MATTLDGRPVTATRRDPVPPTATVIVSNPGLGSFPMSPDQAVEFAGEVLAAALEPEVRAALFGAAQVGLDAADEAGTGHAPEVLDAAVAALRQLAGAT